jgi:hypothetical protein
MVKVQSTCFALLKQYIDIWMNVIHSVTLHLTPLQMLTLHRCLQTLKLVQFSEYLSMQIFAEPLLDELVQNCIT